MVKAARVQGLFHRVISEIATTVHDFHCAMSVPRYSADHITIDPEMETIFISAQPRRNPRLGRWKERIGAAGYESRRGRPGEVWEGGERLGWRK